jgi:predicted enzyme related to lactoylglutathione lyase
MASNNSMARSTAPLRNSVMGLGAIIATLCIANSPPANAQSYALPALVEPASSEHHTGKPVFEELVTPDLAAAKQFYTNLFGWTYSDVTVGPVHYAQAWLDGRAVAGLVENRVTAGQHRQPAWITFMSVPDVDAAVQTATEHGAKVLLAPRVVTGRGKEAIMADPQGAVFGVIASDSGDPTDALSEPGEWIWSSLVTSDPDKAAGFYQTLFHYDVYELPESGPGMHLILASDNFSRASANPLPGRLPNARPHWLDFVRVSNVDQAAAKAQSLGGQVLVAPHPDRHGGKIAVVADDGGAPFGLMEYDDTAAAADGSPK